MPGPQNILRRLITRLDTLFGRGLVLSMGVVLAIGLTVSLGVFIFFNTAATTTLTITSGPAGSSFSRNVERLMSLGSINYQPLMIFYQGEVRQLLSEFKGARLDIGVEGSGTRLLALALLKANGIEANVNRIVVPASFGDRFYGLRGHVNFVRNSLLAETAPVAAEADGGDASMPS